MAISLSEMEPIGGTPITTSGISINELEPIPPKPVIKEANWWDTVSVAPGLAASNIVESAAGVADIVGADKKAKEWRQDAAAARKYVDEAYPVDPNSWKGAARGAATSIYTQAPGMALGLLTGGSTLPLTIMGTQAGTQKMSELIDAGVEKWKAVPLSMVSGAIEAFTEKIPFEKFIDIAKVSKGRAANIVKMMLYEQGGEQLATLGDQVIDLVKPDASWSWEDYKKAVIQTAKTTLLQTGTMATVATTINKAAETVDRRRRKGESTPPVKTTTSTEIEPIVTGKKVKAAKARPDIQAGLDTLKEESKKELAEMLIENKQIEAEQSAQAKAVKNEEPINLEDLEALNQYSGKGVEADTIIKNELEGLDKLNILEQEQVATQQNSVQNLNKAVVEQTNPEEAKWKKARQIALESGVDEDTLTELDKLPIEERKSWFNRLSVDNPTMVSLAAEKITEDEAKANKIAKWVDFQNRMQAKKVDRKPTNIDNVPTQTVSNFQTKLGNLLAEVGAKKIEDLTDEQLDRAEQIVEEAYDIGLDEAAEAPLNTKMSDETFEEIAKRIHKINNTFFNKLYTSYFKNIDTQVEEEGHIPELDEVPKEVKKAATRRRQSSKVPLEDTPENRQAILNKMDNDIKLSKNELPLAKKMATEIREGKEKEDSINEMLGDSTPMTDREASEFAKQRTLDLLEDPEIKTNINKARSLLSNIYKFRPDTEEDAVGWLDKIRLAESTVKDIVGHKKIAFTRKAISKAVANKDISPEIGAYMNKVFNLLKVQPTFNLNWLERKESESSEGLYDFAQNLIKLRNPYALAHEVGHFAWYNVLTSEDRIAYMQHFINTYYTGNNLDFSKLRLDTTNPSNAVRNPAEAFACKFSDYTHDKVFSKIEMSLMKKVQAWFSELKNKLVRRRGQNVTYDGVERIFDKVLDKQVRRTWSESFGEPVTEQAVGYEADYSIKDKVSSVLDKLSQLAVLARLSMSKYSYMTKMKMYPTYSKKIDQRDYSSMLFNGKQIPEFIKQYGTHKWNIEQIIVNSMIDGIDSLSNLKTSILRGLQKEHVRIKYYIDKLQRNDKEAMQNYLDGLEPDIEESLKILKTIERAFSDIKKADVKASHLLTTRGQVAEIKFENEDILEGIFIRPYDKNITNDPTKIIKRDNIKSSADVDYSKKIPILMLDPFGLQTMYNRVKLLVETKKNAERDSEGRKILATIKQNDWGLAAPVDDKTVVNKDQAGHWERLKRSFLRPLLQSPSEIMGTILENHVFNINTAEHNIGFMYDIHSTSIDNIEADLIKDFNILEKGFAKLGDRFTDERIKQTYKNVIDIAEGKKTNGTQAEIDAAARIRDWLDIMKDKQKAKLMKAFKQHLSKTEYNALLDLLSGISPEHIRVKFPKLSLDVLTGIAKEYQEISNWGIENYIPHMMRGQYKIVTIAINKEGKPYQKLVSVGFTEDDAVRKAADYLSDPENKDKKLFIDTSFKEFDNTKTSLNRKQYYAIMNKLAKQVKNMDSSINDKLAKEMARRAVRGQFSMKPTDTFSPFLQDREDILPGEDNIFPVLKAYAYSMEKKWALDDVIDLVRKDLGKMTTEQREWITEYIDDVKGRYGYGDKVLDDILGKRKTMFGKTIYEGASTRTFSRAMSKVRALEANIKFGYRPVAGFVNLMSGQGHVWVKRGAKLWNEGRKFLNTDEGKSLIKEVERSLGTSVQDIGDTVKSKTPMWKPMGLFQAPESINRKMSVACAYLDGVSQGMTHAEARTYAIRACWAEQFTYNIANLPRIMRRSPAMRTFLQFKPYLIKEIEFMSNLSKGEALRYIGLQLALGGPRGAIMIAKTIPVLMLFSFWQEFMDDAEEWMMKNIPNISMGVGGLPGLFDNNYAMNWMGPATIQFPSKASDLAGPFVGDLMRIASALLNPVKELSTAGSIFPIYKHWKNIWDLYFAKDNILRDDRGNKVYEVKDFTPFIMQSLLGIENANINRFRTSERILYNRDKRDTAEKTKHINNIMQYIANGKPIPNEELLKAIKHGVTVESLRNRVKQMNLTPRLRAVVNAEIRKRYEVFEAFPDESDSESNLLNTPYESPDPTVPKVGDYY